MLLLLVGAAVAGSFADQPASQATAADHPSIVQRFLKVEEQSLTSYTAIRRLTATTRAGRLRASIEVRTRLDPINGFQYEILSEEGSGLIRRKVLVAALEAEQAAFKSAEAAGARLTPANYDFLGVSVASQNLYKIDVRARRKNQMLIDGALFVDGDSADLVRMEGELSKRPSIWTRRVRIVREYRRIDGVHVPISMQSTADVLVVGSSTFSMTYRYLEINGHPVGAERPSATAMMLFMRPRAADLR
jgi:hypothetical protein